MSGVSSLQMSSVPVSINIDDDEWQQKIDRLRALQLAEGRELQVEFTRFARVYTAAKGGDLEEFIRALKEYSEEETASLYDIISTKNPFGNSLLHVTAGIENADLLRALLEVTDDELLAAQENDRGDTALHVAARARNISTAQHLLKFSIVDKVNEDGSSALHEAVQNSDYDLTDLLLQNGSLSMTKKNKENKCPLHLAIETGERRILSRLLQAVDENDVLLSWDDGMILVSEALRRRQSDMLEEIIERKQELFDLKDARKETPLHKATLVNYVDGVKFLVNKFPSSAFQHNQEGYLPIHVACRMGHLETIKLLRQYWPDWLEPEELLTLKQQHIKLPDVARQNILHVAAKYGRASVVKYILGDPKLEKLINAKDKQGNTPLHVATEEWQPEVLFSLTRDNRVNLGLVNRNNFTALDIVDTYPNNIEGPFHKSLTRIILVSAGAPKSKSKEISRAGGSGPRRLLPSISILSRRAEVRMVVATLIASVTFAAGFSIPGGYNSSEPYAGMATLLNKPMYDVFVICNSIAMYNSIIALVILLWTQIEDSHAMFHVLRMTRLPLLIALATMSVAFMAGVYVTISKRTWVAIIALAMGITALFVILILYIALYVPLGYKCRPVQLFTDYIIRAAILISRREGVTEEMGAPGDRNEHGRFVTCSL